MISDSYNIYFNNLSNNSLASTADDAKITNNDA